MGRMLLGLGIIGSVFAGFWDRVFRFLDRKKGRDDEREREGNGMEGIIDLKADCVCSMCVALVERKLCKV